MLYRDIIHNTAVGLTVQTQRIAAVAGVGGAHVTQQYSSVGVRWNDTPTTMKTLALLQISYHIDGSTYT